MPLVICHEGHSEADGTAYFGPFSREEITERLNDAYGDLLAVCGNLDSEELPEDQMWKVTNTREYWMEQLAAITSEKRAPIMALSIGSKVPVDPTQWPCPESPGKGQGDNSTHHFIPRGSGALVCRYCRKGRSELVEEGHDGGVDPDCPRRGDGA